MRTPTTEQRAALQRPACRVRVIGAVPGSGKTWLVAELIRQELEDWPSRTTGVAALSFTHVGRDEIRKAVDHEMAHPHFVGTIDAFLFRYIVRPFFQRVFPQFASPRILAAEWGADHWGYYAHKQKATTASSKAINLFGCVFIGEQNGESVIARKSHPAQPLRPLTGDDLLQVKKAKLEVWKKHGLLTHSDAALWASKILEHQTMGVIVRAEVVRRFPFLIVDELQDTGHFLGKSIRLLLEEPVARGVVVGDPDQAIYEFNGARPELFDTFETISGAGRLPLSNSRRCPSTIVVAANHLKDSGGSIGAAQDRIGRALLVRYNDMLVDVPKVLEAVRASRTQGVLKVVARASATVDALAGRRAERPPNLHCPSLTHIHRAVVAFRQGRNIFALASARAALDRATFQHEGVNDQELAAAKIDPHSWKTLAIRCLLNANAIGTNGTSMEWHTQAGEMLDEEISNFEFGPQLTFVKGKLRPQQRAGWNTRSADFLPNPSTSVHALAGTPIQTVHGVKGETHDVTIFVCPQTTEAHCPSTVWWSTGDKDREEKRIAYVAMTRTQGDLLVCVSKACYERLAARRAAFVGSFECMTVAQCVMSLGQDTVTGK
jgi:ATP-dependent DNA helicase UvrD/PcrA